jgi:DNA-binding Xre family transcriptional regulator
MSSTERQRWARGLQHLLRKRPGLPRETLTALCDALEVAPGELFAFTPEKKRKAG